MHSCIRSTIINYYVRPTQRFYKRHIPHNSCIGGC